LSYLITGASTKEAGDGDQAVQADLERDNTYYTRVYVGQREPQLWRVPGQLHLSEFVFIQGGLSFSL
jgi:hypothetical protein